MCRKISGTSRKYRYGNLNNWFPFNLLKYSKIIGLFEFRRIESKTTRIIISTLFFIKHVVSSINYTQFIPIFSKWEFGLGYCIFNHFTSLVAVSASVFSLLAITLDRRLVSSQPSFLSIILWRKESHHGLS